ncbi:YdcF family protein [Mastigocladopsis repens]|uniref:YdcF family protein n=1 Tax=Mastigocladopsis repens TaxID=221287 RepID=UPI0003193DA0|nr:YdcF family protein [Mastigocladopsis repens]
MKQLHQQLKTYWIFGLTGFIVILISIIPVRLAIAFGTALGAIAHYQAPHPQAILTLGGGQDREEFTAEFAQADPSLEIWVSSGILPNKAREIFRAVGILDQRVHLDYRAIDTVTNFTSLVKDFKSRNIQHLYLITSDFHMLRAKAIGTIVLGSQGITFTPISIPSNEPEESFLRILRDSCRSILWIFTGRTGASLSPRVAHLSYAFR